jgi:acetyl-CoA carboxylase carboxyltransferase component
MLRHAHLDGLPVRFCGPGQLVNDASPYGAAGRHLIHDVIDPRTTRQFIARALQIAFNHRRGGIGEHKLANWPTKF